MPRRRLDINLTAAQRQELLDKLDFVSHCYNNTKYYSLLRNMRTQIAAQCNCSPSNISMVLNGTNFNPHIINALYTYVSALVSESISALSAINQTAEILDNGTPRQKLYNRTSSSLAQQQSLLNDLYALIKSLHLTLSKIEHLDNTYASIDRILADEEVLASLPEVEYFRAGNGQQLNRLHLPSAIRQALTTLATWGPRLTTADDFFAALQGEELP